MNYVSRLLINRCIYNISKESKRLAGHSKWQNIKHTKTANDASRAALFLSFRKRMQIAILEEGNANPETNIKLARIIDQCKKANMPAASIKSYLEKFSSSNNKTQSALIEIHGPRNCIMVVKLMSDNIVHTKLQFRHVLGKIDGTKVVEGTINSTFNHHGVIITETKNDLEKAVDDALNIGATDIEEIGGNDSKCYKFICEPEHLMKIVTKLENLGYNIIDSKEEFIPFSPIKLSDEDLEIIKLAQEKLFTMNEVHEIYDNVDRAAPSS